MSPPLHSILSVPKGVSLPQSGYKGFRVHERGATDISGQWLRCYYLFQGCRYMTGLKKRAKKRINHIELRLVKVKRDIKMS